MSPCRSGLSPITRPDTAEPGSLTERLEMALERSRREESLVAVLFMDIDTSDDNDTLGHAAEIRPEQAAKRIERCLGPTDTVSRFGGDEFVILIEDVKPVRRHERLAERIMASIEAPMTVAPGTQPHSEHRCRLHHRCCRRPWTFYERRLALIRPRQRAGIVCRLQRPLEPEGGRSVDLEDDLWRACERAK